MDQLRELIESDLADTLSGDFGLPVDLISPDGVKQENIYGQILYDTRIENPQTGGEEIIHKPVVTLRRSELNRIPINGEKWVIYIPITPSRLAVKERFYLEIATEDGCAIGFIRLYLMKSKHVDPPT